MYLILILHAAVTLLVPERIIADEARAVASAMLVHDRSIRDAHWRQTIVHKGADGLDSPSVSVQRFDSKGRWISTFDKVLRRRSDRSAIEVRGSVATDGVVVVGLDHVQQIGSITELRGQRGLELGFDCWLGRHIDTDNHRRLGEVLLEAADLRCDRSGGCFVLSGTLVLAASISILEVEVDPNHAFAPRKITVRDAALRVPFVEYEVNEFISVDGVWLPRRGSLRTRQIHFPDGEFERFENALAEAGLSRNMDYTSPTVQAAYHKVVRDVFHSSEAPSKEKVAPVELEVEYVSVNVAQRTEDMVLKVPMEYRMYDAILDKVKAPGSDEWVPQDELLGRGR